MNLRALLLVPLVCTAFSRAAFGIITINSDALSLSAPSNGAPWGYVARLDNGFGARASGVYLGNRYILTANHVDSDINLIHLDNADFTLDASFTPVSIQGTDMRLLRLAEDPGLPLLPLINSSQSAFSKSATMIGWGVGKGTAVPNQGWNWADDTTRLERWGTSTTLGSYFTDSTSGITYLVTTFNSSAGAQTGQLTGGDSGGGLFINFGGVWTLAGINAAVDTDNQALYDNSLLTAGNQPDRSYFASLTQFTSQIQTLIGGVPIGGMVQYWDGAGLTANGVIDGGVGQWNTTLTNWTNSAGTINSKWQAGTAIFSGPAGTITLSSAISAQALTFNTSGYVIKGTSILTLTGTAPEIDVTNANDIATISAPIAGTKGLKVGGAGTLILTSASNSYTGATAINTGTLQIGTTTLYSKISASSAVSLSQGGTLSLVYLYGNAFANNVSTGAGGGTLNIASSNTMTLSGALTDDGSNALALAQSGTGITILSNAHNTYSGGTTISSGTMQVGTAAIAGSIGANGPVNLLNNSTLALLNVSGGTLGNNIDHTSPGSGLVNVTASGSTTLSGTIANSNGLLALAKNGTGTLVISNFGNSYAGGTTLNTGTLIANGSLGSGTLTIKGGTLGTTLATGNTLSNPISLLGNFSLATNSNPSNPGAQNFILNGNIGLNGVTRTITGTTNMGQPQFGGSIGVPGETAGLNFNTPFTAAGSYVAFIFAPSNVNNYTGLTTVNNGAILAFEGATPNGAIRGNLSITGNGVVDYIMGSSSAEQIADTSTVTVNSSGNTASGIHFDGLEIRGASETIGTLNGSGKVGLGSGTLTVGSGTFSGIIEDGAFAVGTGGSLIKNTAGTLILSGKNTYTGFTSVAEGTLQAGAVNTIPSASPLYVAAGGTFKLNNFSQNVASVTGYGNINLGSGTLTVGSANTNVGFSGAISGTGGLTKVGAGILGLNGSNTYTGPTTLTRGMLLIAPTSTVPVLSSSSRLVVGGTAVADGGTFALYGVPNTSTSQIFNGLTINAGSTLIAVDNLGTTTTLDLRGVSGTLGITRNANGFVDFQAVNGTLGVDAIIRTHQANNASGILGGWATVNGGTGFAANNGADVIVAYTGYTDIAASSDTVPNSSNRNIRINSAGAGGSDVIAAHPLTAINTLTQNTTTASTVALAGGTLKLGTDGGILITPNNAGLTIGAAPRDGVLTAVGTGTISLANYSTNGPLTINSAITNAGGGAISVRFTGNGLTVFAGANTYTGSTAILSGVLRTDAVNSIPSTSAVTLNSIATLDLNNNSQTVASINDGPSGGGNIALGIATLTLGGNGNSLLTGVISGTNGSLVKAGTGSLTLSGANTYTGGTTLNTGTLIANGSLGSGTLTIKGGTLGTTLATGNTLSNPISLLGNFSLATNSNPSNPGAQNFILNGNIGLNGVTRTITGTTNMGQPQFGGSIGVPGETAGLNFNTSFTAAGSYVAFILAPSNVNNYTGLTTVNNGAILVFEGATPNGAIRGNVNITGNGVVDYIMGSSSAEQIADTSTVTVTSLGNTVSGSHFDGLELRGANETIGALNGSGKVGLGSGTLTVGSGTFSGIIEDGAFGTGGSLIKNTAGTLILSGRNTYTGFTAVTAGTLQAAAANTIPVKSMVGVGAGATFDLHNFSQSVGSIVNVNGAGGTIKLGTAVLTTGNDGQNAVFSGVIQGSGRLVKVGTGGLNLTEANTYTGGTTISAGVLLANNASGSATGSGAVAVNSGATLGGGGTILGAVTLNNGGIVNPGVATPGTAGTTLHATSMMWNGGGTLKLQLGAPGDELVLTGALTKGTAGVYAINIADAGLTETSYTLATFASTTFAPANFTLTLPAGDTGNLILTSTSLVLDVTSVASNSSTEQPASYDSGGVLSLGQTSGVTPTQTIDSGQLWTSNTYSGATFTAATYSGATFTVTPNITLSPDVTLNSNTSLTTNISVTPTPEPSGVALLCVGAMSLLGRRRRRQR